MNDDSQPINFRGISAAFATPLFLGMAPIFGKIAIAAGADGFTVAALRTILAVLLLWIVYLLFLRRYIYIYPAGLLGCIIIGTINGVGSLFYYGGLEILDASLVQLINGSYLAFAVLLSRIGGQRATSRTLIRVLMAMTALTMITGLGGNLNWLGVGLMLANALMFAATVILSQYILYEMPSFTFTLYTLTTMGVVVTMVWLAVSPPLTATVFEATIVPVALLGLTTALSRLAMFASVKFLGGMQTAILGITEIAVALVLAAVVLGETLTAGQWLGTGLLLTSILLIQQKDLLPHGFNPNALIVANMSSVQFQRIAFHRAFGTHENDNEHGTMATLTTQEMIAIQRMMGATSGAIDPFPIGRAKQGNNGYQSSNALERMLTNDPITEVPEPSDN
ncbi:MAG: DMT family transporter [Anaerolineae bacterium]|nr:DMT family transporter [Anaerolineae bacterium]